MGNLIAYVQWNTTMGHLSVCSRATRGNLIALCSKYHHGNLIGM